MKTHTDTLAHSHNSGTTERTNEHYGRQVLQSMGHPRRMGTSGDIHERWRSFQRHLKTLEYRSICGTNQVEAYFKTILASNKDLIKRSSIKLHSISNVHVISSVLFIFRTILFYYLRTDMQHCAKGHHNHTHFLSQTHTDTRLHMVFAKVGPIFNSYCGPAALCA